MKKNPSVIIPLAIGVLTLFFVFLVRGPLMSYPDTKVYIGQIEYFKGATAPDRDIELRSFKPFYGVAGAELSKLVSGDTAILLINILFFFGLIISFYYLLKEIGFSELYAAIGASWVATGYPLLKYGLALLTDISGWFFAAATIAIFLIGMRKKSNSLLVLSSVVAFVGSLCKETGILGLGFAGLYLLLHLIIFRNFSFLKKIVLISFPFILLQTIFLYILFTKSETHTTFIQWFSVNKNVIGDELHTLYQFAVMELSTFNLFLAYAGTGLYFLWRNRSRITPERAIVATCLFVTILPPLIWPVFLTRVLYSGYLAVIPLSLIGLWYVHKKYNFTPIGLFVFASFPVIVSLTLFLLAGEGSLFPLFEKLF